MRSGTKAKTEKQPTTEATFHSLLRAWGLMRQLQEPYFAKYGISGAQWGILRVLQRAELEGVRELPLKEVGERLFIQPPSVTGVVDRMERLGLVKRTHSKDDLRVKHLTLTTRGRRLVDRVLKRHAERIASLFAPLGPNEQETLLGLMGRLETHLREMAMHEEANGVIADDAA